MAIGFEYQRQNFIGSTGTMEWNRFLFAEPSEEEPHIIIHVKVSGVWKTVQTVWAKVSGTWEQVTSSIKVEGVWISTE